MYKKASRFQQRLGAMIGSGMFTRDPMPQGDNRKRLSPYEQQILKSKQRLARIRRTFEIEAEIASRSEMGENVSLLREELAKVKSGEIRVPLSLARDPRPLKNFVGITLARKDGPNLVAMNPQNNRRRQRKPLLTAEAIKGALLDLSKSKLTTEGIAIAKVMLDQFEIDIVSEALGIDDGFLAKVAKSPIYELAPRIQAEDALLIVEVLEAKLDAEHVATKQSSGTLEIPASSTSDVNSAPPKAVGEALSGDNSETLESHSTQPPIPASEVIEAPEDLARRTEIARLRRRRIEVKVDLQNARAAVRAAEAEVELVEADLRAALRI